MTLFNYIRVTRKRICRICGKPDWCSYTPDVRISFCARINQNADRLSRTGWGVFYHDKHFSSESGGLPCSDQPILKKPELAPARIRDFAYRKLIELAPASGCEEILNGDKGLAMRKIFDFENYGSLPQLYAERRKIAKKVRCLINENFPEFVRNRGGSFNGIPGFWLDKEGRAAVWTEKDYDAPMMLIPYRDAEGFIQACQIRFMSRAYKKIRYVWLSTPKKSGGLSSGTPVHFASRSVRSQRNAILITEGALKAETVCFFKPQYSVIAASGVSCSHEEIIRAVRRQNALFAFDSDYRRNPLVARHVAGLLEMRFRDAELHDYKVNTNFLVWSDKYKGIDDALLDKASVSIKSASEFMRSL